MDLKPIAILFCGDAKFCVSFRTVIKQHGD